MLLFFAVCILLLITTPFTVGAEMSASGYIERPELTSVCLEFSAKGNRGTVSKRTCAEPGRESDWLWIGDDTGYRDQKLTVIAYGGGEVCLRFTAVNRRGKLLDRGWACSSRGIPSQQLWIGDDTGYRNQNLRIRTNSNTVICLDSIRKGRRGEQRSGWVCSSNFEPSGENFIGDDSGYRNQRLKIRIASQQPEG